MPYRPDPGTLAGLLCVIVIAIVVALLTLIGRAHAVDNGQWGDVDPATRSWFKSVKSKNGVPCCDISDGHKTQFKTDAEGKFYVPINTTNSDDPWVPVPPEAIIYDAGNPYEEAVVWYVMQGPGVFYIRCFVPVGGV